MFLGATYMQGRDAYRASTALASLSRQTGDKRNLADIQKGILDRAGTVAQTYGVKRGDVIRSMLAFQAPTGSVQGALDLSGYITAIAEATASQPEDVAKLAGLAFKFARDKDVGMTEQQATRTAKQIVGSFAGHAAKESIEMSEYAAVAPPVLGAATKMMSSDFAQTAAIASAVAQKSIGGGSKGAAEAATATARLVDDLTFHQEKILALTRTQEFGGNAIDVMGIDPVTKIRKLRGFEETIPALLAATKGDQSKLQKLGINVRGNRAMTGFLDEYALGTKRQGSGTPEEKGAAAVRDFLLAAISDRQRVSEGEAKELAKSREELDPYAKLEKALLRLADQSMPILTQAVEKLASALGGGDPTSSSAIVTRAGTEAFKDAVENPGTTAALLLGVGATAKGLLGALGTGLKANALRAAGALGMESFMGVPVAEAAAMTAPGFVSTLATGLTAGVAALGGGAAATLGVAGGLAAGGVGLAGYNLYKAIEENSERPFMLSEPDLFALSGLPDPRGFPTNAGELMGTLQGRVQENIAAGARPGDALKTSADKLGAAADKLTNAANSLSSSSLNRGDAPSSASPSSPR